MLRPFVAAAVATLALAGPAPIDAATTMSGADVVAALNEGRLSLTSARITGDIDFRTVDVVPHAFSCVNCHIEGRILGDDVVFAATVELSGSRITGGVSMRRATFRSSAVFDSTAASSTSFDGRLDFGFTRFGDLATFAGARFARAANFTAARFGGEVVFAGAMFQGTAGFERVAAQGNVDFRDCHFDRPATFDAADFGDVADFSYSRFGNEAPATFTGARFTRNASFVGVVFASHDAPESDVRFDRASVGRDLVFDLAQFAGQGNFRRATAGGALSFDRAVLKPPPGKELVFRDVTAQAFTMAVDDARTAVQPGDRKHVLELIEAGAKARGDLGVANDARFSLEVMKSHDQPWWKRIPNVVFFRVVAGYFVRPFHPIAALLLLVAIVAVVRVGRASARPVGAALRRFGHEFLDALALILPGGDGADRRLETIAYRVLVVCALIGLANSNPTLREMFDALV